MARYYEQQFRSMSEELENLKRSTEAQWLNRYIRFINETGRREEFLLWAAKDIGMDEETINRVFPASGCLKSHTPNAETIAALEENEAAANRT